MAQKQNLATKSDVKKLHKGISENRKAIEANRKEILAFKWEMDQRFQTHEEKTEKMITGFKNEIFNHFDPMMKELQANREEHTIIDHQLDSHEKRITYLETA